MANLSFEPPVLIVISRGVINETALAYGFGWNRSKHSRKPSVQFNGLSCVDDDATEIYILSLALITSLQLKGNNNVTVLERCT